MGTTTALLLAAQAVVKIPPGVQFYRFPVDPEICREWIRRVNRTGFAVTANSRLCSNHFSGKKKLSPLHLPTIFSHQTYAKKYARAPPRKRVSVDLRTLQRGPKSHLSRSRMEALSKKTFRVGHAEHSTSRWAGKR